MADRELELKLVLVGWRSEKSDSVFYHWAEKDE